MTTTTTTENPNQPVDQVQIGYVEAAIWKNVDREGRVFYSATFKRKYVDKDDNLRSTHTFGRNDMLNLAKVVDKTHTRILDMEEIERLARRKQAEESQQAGEPQEAAA